MLSDSVGGCRHYGSVVGDFGGGAGVFHLVSGDLFTGLHLSQNVSGREMRC